MAEDAEVAEPAVTGSLTWTDRSGNKLLVAIDDVNADLQAEKVDFSEIDTPTTDNDAGTTERLTPNEVNYTLDFTGILIVWTAIFIVVVAVIFLAMRVYRFVRDRWGVAREEKLQRSFSAPTQVRERAPPQAS